MVNILPADTYTVINKTILTENDRKILTMLYQPIIGSDSINLFFTLWMDLDKNEFMSMEENHHHLMTSMSMPLDRIVLETDCPYLTPSAYGRKRNDSSKISAVISEIAKMKGITEEEVVRQTNENAKKE